MTVTSLVIFRKVSIFDKFITKFREISTEATMCHEVCFYDLVVTRCVFVVTRCDLIATRSYLVVTRCDRVVTTNDLVVTRYFLTLETGFSSLLRLDCKSWTLGWESLVPTSMWCYRDFSRLFLGPNFGPIPNGKSAYIFPKSRWNFPIWSTPNFQ